MTDLRAGGWKWSQGQLNEHTSLERATAKSPIRRLRFYPQCAQSLTKYDGLMLVSNAAVEFPALQGPYKATQHTMSITLLIQLLFLIRY